MSATPVEVKRDARGRVSLGKLGVRPGQKFLVFDKPDGTIILQPVDSAPEESKP